jgi:hypothetical protein
VGQGGQAVASQFTRHTGSYAARIGVQTLLNGVTEPAGDDCLYQNVALSGTHSLSLYYAPYDLNADTITYDWQEAYWRPFGITGCSETGLQIFKVESNSQAWTAAGLQVSGNGQIYFNVHGDGFTDPTALYVDDIRIS